jgi:hypothetical protein
MSAGTRGERRRAGASVQARRAERVGSSSTRRLELVARSAYAGRREQATCRTRASAAGARPGRRRAARSEQWRVEWPGARVRQQACAAAAQERLAGGAGAKRPSRTGGVTAARTSTRERASAGTGAGSGLADARERGKRQSEEHALKTGPDAGQAEVAAQRGSAARWRARCRRCKRASVGVGPQAEANGPERAGRIQTREQQHNADQERVRFGRARMEVRCGDSGPTRTKSNEVVHGSTLARTVVEGPATRQGRGECGPDSRMKKNNHAGQQRAERQRVGGRHAMHGSVSAGRAQATTELSTGGSRGMGIRGRRGEGNGRSPTSSRTTRGEFGGGQVRANLDPRGGGEALMARQVGRRSCVAKAAVRRDELGGTSMQPSTADSFITHGISSPSSTSHRQSCLPREFTFRVFSFITKATPRFALIH